MTAQAVLKAVLFVHGGQFDSMVGGGGGNTFKLKQVRDRVEESLKVGSKCKVRMKNVPVLTLKQSTGSFKKGINYF